MDVCRVCGAEGRFPHHVVPEMMFGTRELFDYFECEACGCLQIASIPSDLSRHYPASYYSNAVEPPVRIWLTGQRVRHGLGEPSLLGAWMSRRYGPDACCRAMMFLLASSLVPDTLA